jgi:DNA-binding MarR family transcriptional regulator
VSGIFDRLEQAGFARRERDATDHREIFAQPLPAVARRIAGLFEPMQRAMAITLTGHDETELAPFVDFLTGMFLTGTRKHAVAATATLRTTRARPKRSQRHRASKFPRG